MAKAVSAKRHAQAVFQIALEKNELDRWRADLENIADALKEPSFVALLENPKVHFDQKATVLKQVFTDISPLAMNLINFLVVKNRLKIFDSLVDEYMRMVDEHYGKERAEVVTAIPLDGEAMDRLQKKLAAVTQKDIVIKAEVDPEIRGGLVAKIGDKLIDGSVRTKLKDLKRGLSEAGLSDYVLD